LAPFIEKLLLLLLSRLTEEFPKQRKSPKVFQSFLLLFSKLEPILQNTKAQLYLTPKFQFFWLA